MCTCADLRCILRWKNDADLPACFASFLKAHSVVKNELCTTHGTPGTPHKKNYSLCICWRRKGNNKCRKRLSTLSPFFSAKQKKPESKFLFWVKLCQRVEMDSIASQCCVTRNTVFKWKRELLDWISKAVAKRNEETKFHKCAADETLTFSSTLFKALTTSRRNFLFQENIIKVARIVKKQYAWPPSRVSRETGAVEELYGSVWKSEMPPRYQI